MTTTIETVKASYDSVKIKMLSSDNRTFFMTIEDGKIQFWSDESSSGALSGKPIVKTVDEVLDWIGSDGTKKKFIERSNLKPKMS